MVGVGGTKELASPSNLLSRALCFRRINAVLCAWLLKRGALFHVVAHGPLGTRLVASAALQPTNLSESKVASVLPLHFSVVIWGFALAASEIPVDHQAPELRRGLQLLGEHTKSECKPSDWVV